MAQKPLSAEQLKETVDAFNECGGVVSYAAKALGIPRNTLDSRLMAARRMGLLPSGGGGAPLSEDTHKFRPEWTSEMCLTELRRIAEIDTTRIVTRNYFRNNSDISESTWDRYFGTFEEFKRQAGIILSRHVHRLEKNIALHASKDVQRDMNEQKSDWAEAYLRPQGGRFQTVLVCSDIHDKHCDPFYRRLLVDTARRVQPEKVVLNGDIFDLPEFSRFSQDPRAFDLVGRIKWVHALLEDLRTAAPNAELTFVEGNHEYRLLRHLAEATPAMMVVLADLHGMSVASLLGLTKYEVNYIARMDLTTFNEFDIKSELKKNYVLLYDALLFHHFPEGRAMGYPGANGHHHKHIVWNAFSPTYGSYEWHQLGAGHMRQASYCSGEKWSNGFMLCHVDTAKKYTQFEYIDCTFEHCTIGGLMHIRTEEERRAV